jgi:hypothetical protein
MNNLIRIVLSFSVIALAGETGSHKLPDGFASQFIPLTFAKVVADHKLRKGMAGTKIKANEKMVFDTDIHPLAIKVTYTGKSRKLGPDRLDFEKHFEEATEKSNKTFFSRYHNEIEVLEAEKTYWVAVDDSKLGSLSAEAKPDSKLTIYVRYLGQIANDPISFLIDFSSEKEKD